MAARTHGPVSVVIPAHDEGAVIDRCLDALLREAPDGLLDVVVVCNGCTDDTAARARSHSGVRVVEIAEASKVRALNAGDVEAQHFPRIYLDADIELMADAALRTAEALGNGDGLCAAPQPTFELTGRPYVVRAFYRIWSMLPYLSDEPVGNGVYALSEAGRRRFRNFPDLTADDLFVRNLFDRDERRCLRDSTFVIHTPRSARGLFAMRVRAYRGTQELRTARPDLEAQRDGAGGGVLRLLCTPATSADTVVYVAVNLLAKTVAVWRTARGVTGWERDESARSGGKV